MAESKIIDELLRMYSHESNTDRFFVHLLKNAKAYGRRENLLSLKFKLEELEMDRRTLCRFYQTYHDDLYEEKDGVKTWTMNGKLHCEATSPDGLTYPALVSPTRKEWYFNGVLHRYEMGNAIGNPYTYQKPLPAIEESNGTRKWFLYGKEYPQEKMKPLTF